MAKHKDENKDSKTSGSSGYEARHSGGWDGEDWAKYSNATAETQQIPKVEKGKK